MGFRFTFRRAAVCAAWLVPALAGAAQPLSVSLAHGSAAEQRTRDQLLRLVEAYPLEKWIRTRTIIVDQDEIPHSHPVLTLHTKHLDRPDLLLSTFIHEQLHWVMSERRTGLAAAVQDLQLMYPTLPVGFPQGAQDAESNYEHLVVIYLEYMADRALLGKRGAGHVMRYWSSSHYTALVGTVVRDEAKIGAVVKKHGLML